MSAETCIHKNANASVPPKFETHLNKFATKPLRCGWTGLSQDQCFENEIEWRLMQINALCIP